ncbi:MAG: polysaccharide biosynthesis protein [Clostridia bacterium]|nr:polysaccharide biosynthesis protein [Clostridia bacterium]
MTQNNKLGGRSVNAVLLTSVKLVTIVIGFIVTRLLSEYLSVYDYGTYSQILLIVSTVSSVTILGMVDGANYFYCSEPDVEKRESYISTIFALQSIVGTVAGAIVICLCGPISSYFYNPDVKKLIVFAAVLPLMQNFLSIVQVLLVSVGRAKMLAGRNLLISLIRLGVVFVVIHVFNNIVLILACTLILDLAQILFFGYVLHIGGCRVRLKRIRFTLVREIARYCAPMAIYIAVSALNHDIDKYLIAIVTDTETLAVYSNAAKLLPFDIITSSFCTVLIPEITRLVSSKRKSEAAGLYKMFLEIAYMSTTILCGAALACAPQLLKLLYSNKYESGLAVFCIYIVVDLLKFTNITLVMSASGKTKRLMLISICCLVLNGLLNPLLYKLIGIVGPAVATLVTTAILGAAILFCGARELDSRVTRLFDIKFLAVFFLENVVVLFLLSLLRMHLADVKFHYFATIILIGGLYCGILLLFNGRRAIRLLKNVNRHEV